MLSNETTPTQVIIRDLDSLDCARSDISAGFECSLLGKEQGGVEQTHDSTCASVPTHTMYKRQGEFLKLSENVMNRFGQTCWLRYPSDFTMT